MGLLQQMERVRVDGLGNVGVGKYKVIAKKEKAKAKNNFNSVNWDIVDSTKYKEKFKGITGDEETDKIICQKARDMLEHGTILNTRICIYLTLQ